jgi:hypothetical protein
MTMSTITADPTLLQVLSQMKEKTEIRDPDGNLVGVYTPTADVEKSLVEKVSKLVDRSELERRKREEGGKGIPTAEVLRHLDSLGTAQ